MEQQRLQGEMIRYIMTHMEDAVCVTDSHGFIHGMTPLSISAIMRSAITS